MMPHGCMKGKGEPGGCVLNGPGAAGVEKIAQVVGSKRRDYKTLPTQFNTEYEKVLGASPRAN
jgi:hypothetical protein